MPIHHVAASPSGVAAPINQIIQAPSGLVLPDLTAPINVTLGGAVNLAGALTVVRLRPPPVWLRGRFAPGTFEGDLALVVRSPDALDAARRLAERIQWQPDTRTAGGVGQLIGLRARAAAAAVPLAQARLDVLAAALLEAGGESRERAWPAGANLAAIYPSVVQRAVRLAEQALLDTEVTPSGLHLPPAGLAVRTKRGRPPGTGTWTSGADLRKAIERAAYELRRQGRRPTQAEVSTYFNAHSGLPTCEDDGSSFRRWLRSFPELPSWSEIVSI